MKYFIITYGCQMNVADSEKIASALEKTGQQPANNVKEADLLVINACSVRQAAIDRVYGQINNFPDKKIIVAGCLLDFDKKRLAQNKNISFWNPDEYFKLPPARLASESVAGGPPRTNKNTANIPIMTGCNNFCSYCVVPYTRGREKSRPASRIIKEVKSLIKKGYKEVILLGQNVNSYKDKKNNFLQLLQKINNLPGDFWLSFLTSHPKDMSDKLIETMARCEKIAPYIHLPVQSGDNEILKKMNRHYTVTHYKNLIKKLRAAFKKHRVNFPPLAISTDIIVGFPGETKKQFQHTANLAREIKFDMIYFAQYSPRPGTAAARLPDDVPQQEKKRRTRILNNILKKTALQNNKKYIGKTVDVLINKIKKDCAIGKTATLKTVKIDANPHSELTYLPKLQKRTVSDSLASVKIIGATAWGLRGKLKADTDKISNRLYKKSNI
ncbi:MiaB/RimO family radical SAM methylthiotransferase [Patescibacteria group bacterium]|nr:MiaB/RimO family radical SAM methylthiotransferase [Patescibacteria group bacterium]